MIVENNAVVRSNWLQREGENDKDGSWDFIIKEKWAAPMPFCDFKVYTLMHMCQGHMSNTRSVSTKERVMGMGLRIKHVITQPWTHRFLFSHKVFY